MKTVNLTELVEVRAKMTPGKYGIVEYDSDGPESALVVVSDSVHIAVMSDYRISDNHEANASGIVATHNAADVLIEVVRAAKALEAAEHAWHRHLLGSADDQAAPYDLRACREAYAVALAKVSL